MKNNNIISILIFVFILTGCGSDLVTILDEYNPPYNIKAIPTNNGVRISFISGVLASDFAGFNIYISPTLTSFHQTNDALTNSQGFLPTISQNNHVRQLFEIEIPGSYSNGTLYNIAITAYGTNSLAENSFIETKIDVVLPVIPRPEDPITLTGTNLNIPIAGNIISRVGNTIVPTAPYRIQYFGAQSNFNDIVTITNNDYDNDFDSISMPIALNGLYVLADNNNILVKLWITDMVGNDITFRWAVQNQANLWNGV